MAYTKQTWTNNTNTSPAGGVSASRLGHIEDGIYDAATSAAAAGATATTAAADAATAVTAASAAAAAATAAAVAAAIYFNVKDPTYGATGNGSTDDSTAVQAAITAAQSAGGGIVFFPIGIYKCTTGLSVTAPGVMFHGGAWDQTTTTVGSIIKAGGTYTNLINVSSAGERFAMTDMSLDGNGTATNLVTVDALNCQFTRSYARRPATNGTGWNVTSGGTSVWLTDCRFNGANQAGCTGFAINGTDSTMTGCKAVNCVDSVTYGSTASGGVMHGSHHTPGSTIGRCAINVAGNAANLQFIGNRIDNHALGSGIQVTPSSNIIGLQIVGNTFYQNVITDATFAAIGLDTSSAHIYQAVITGNVIRSAAAHTYAAMLTAQKLDGTAASNPTRISSDGTTTTGNSVYAAALYGTSSTPLMDRGNVLSTDGTTYVAQSSIGGTAPTGAAPGDLVIVASDGSLTTEADYTDAQATIAGSLLRGRIAPTTAWVEEVFPNPASDRGFRSISHDPANNGTAIAPTTGVLMISRMRTYTTTTLISATSTAKQWMMVAASGSGSCTLAKIGLYRRSGNTATLFAATSSFHANTRTAGPLALGGAVTQVSSRDLTITAGATDIYAAHLYVFTDGTPLTLMVGGGSAAANATNAFLTLPEFASASLSGQSDLPDTFDMTTVTTTGAIRFFGVAV